MSRTHPPTNPTVCSTVIIIRSTVIIISNIIVGIDGISSIPRVENSATIEYYYFALDLNFKLKLK